MIVNLMAAVNVEDGRRLKFLFDYFESDVILRSTGLPERRRITRCRILLLPSEDQLSYGLAFCNPKDQFVRRTGRKISLARALYEANFPKEVRRQVWQTFLYTAE